MSAGRWSDLKPRLVSAIVMLTIGGVDLWVGGLAFHLMLAFLIGAMLWELSRMSGRGQWGLWIGLAGGLSLWAALSLLSAGHHGLLAALPLAVAPLLGAVLGGATGRRRQAGYSLVILMAGLSIGLMRDLGLASVLWLMSVVIISDILGYFVGRIVGGPKFWPRISPKKTWSGTAAGWIGAAFVGWGFALLGYGAVHLIWISPLIAFAGQLGDIAESAIKRRAGVKDSSNLIPGHGGVLDRFDALITASVAVVPFYPLLGFGG